MVKWWNILTFKMQIIAQYLCYLFTYSLCQMLKYQDFLLYIANVLINYFFIDYIVPSRMGLASRICCSIQLCFPLMAADHVGGRLQLLSYYFCSIFFENHFLQYTEVRSDKFLKFILFYKQCCCSRRKFDLITIATCLDTVGWAWCSLSCRPRTPRWSQYTGPAWAWQIFLLTFLL